VDIEPTGRHHHDGKQNRSMRPTRFMKPALSGNADAPIGATDAVQDIGIL
jgi:hypothetical protein